MTAIDRKLAEATKYLSKEFKLSEEEAVEIIYEEWDLVLNLIEVPNKHWCKHLADEINSIYKIA